MTTVQATTPVRPAQRTRRAALQTRHSLLASGALAVLLALLVIAQTTSAYQTAYNLFQQIAVINSTKVNAAEEALQRLANTSQATADYTALSSDTPLYEQAQNNIFRNFQDYRDQMFILESNLESADEHTAFTVADTYTYSRFWRHVSNLMAQRSDLTAARQEYLFADAQLRNRIIPALQELEALNFNDMVDAGKTAGSSITGQVIALFILGGALGVALTYLSFWLRGKVRRYLTPEIDVAMVLSWVLLIVTATNLLALPAQLQTMTQDAYFSISGASRVLVAANQANRAESSAIIDQERSGAWYQQFDDDMKSVELRLCGAPGCTANSFVEAGSAATPSTAAVTSARTISAENSAAIDGITPLMGNINFPGEAAVLEKARLAYLDYIATDVTLRQDISAGNIDDAITLNTDTSPGTSEEAFNRFVKAMDELRTINSQVFNDIWNEQRDALPRNQAVYGIIGYLLVMGLVGLGVNHRYREL
jgi:hypothetical protein